MVLLTVYAPLVKSVTEKPFRNQIGHKWFLFAYHIYLLNKLRTISKAKNNFQNTTLFFPWALSINTDSNIMYISLQRLIIKIFKHPGKLKEYIYHLDSTIILQYCFITYPSISLSINSSYFLLQCKGKCRHQ